MPDVIEVASDLEEYLQAWNAIMSLYYWYNESPVFDWNKLEEIDDMTESFHEDSHRFFVYRKSATSEIEGLMGIRLSKPEAVIQRWEPAAKPGLDTDVITTKLLKKGIDIARESGCEKIRIIQKYPIARSDSGLRLIRIYEANGFGDPHAPSVELFMSTSDKQFNPVFLSKIEYATREGYTDEELADLIVRCFTSTEEDRRIHMKDQGVTDPEVTLIVVRRTREGGYGESPPECTHLALVDGRLAGIVGSFIRSDRYHPRVGVLGPVGVLPQYRRMGIASFLVTSALKNLKEMGCLFSAVGTPENNYGAIQLYQRCGFQDRNRLVTLRLQL